MKIREIVESFHSFCPLGGGNTIEHKFVELVVKNKSKSLPIDELANKCHALAAYLGIPTAIYDEKFKPFKTGLRLRLSRHDGPVPYGLVPKGDRHWDTKTLTVTPDENFSKNDTAKAREILEKLVHELAHYQVAGKFRKEPDFGMGPVDTNSYHYHSIAPNRKASQTQIDNMEWWSSVLMIHYFAFIGDFKMAYFVLTAYGGMTNEEIYFRSSDWLYKNKLLDPKTAMPVFTKNPTLA